MTDIAELRGKTPDELEALLLDLRKEQFNLRFQRATGQLEAVSRVRQVRRDIARIKTLQAAANPSRRAILRGAKPARATTNPSAP